MSEAVVQDTGEAGITSMVKTFARDQAAFFGLLMELANYCGTCIAILDRFVGNAK